jgi:hypothetical protein
MSLTRAEWKEMWLDINQIEDCIREHVRASSSSHNMALAAVDRIKAQIQSVVGQLLPPP